MLLADVKSVPGWNTAASIPPHTADTRAPETPVYFPIDGRCCEAGMALGYPADSLLLLLQQLLWRASPHPRCPVSPLPPAEKAEWFIPCEPVTVTAAEVWEQRGEKEGSIPACHCSAAAAAALKPLREDLYSHRLQDFPRRTREDHRGCEGEWLSWFIREYAINGTYFGVAAGAERMRVPLRIEASDNGTSRGNLATSVVLANRIYGQC